MPDRIQFRRVADDWTAVYLNGDLVRVGDSYHADEWLQQHYAVEIVNDTDQTCMIDSHNAHPTLDAVHTVEKVRADRRARVARLREKIADIEAGRDDQ